MNHSHDFSSGGGEQPPPDLAYCGFNHARGMYQYRDGGGRLWEGHPSNVFGTLRRVDEAPQDYFGASSSPPAPTQPVPAPAQQPRQYAATSPFGASPPATPLSPFSSTASTTSSTTPATPATPATPMTHFPDTWDPPAGYEVDDLPSGKRLAHKFGNFRRNVVGGPKASSKMPPPPSTSAEMSESRMYQPRAGTWSHNQKAALARGDSTATSASAPVGVSPEEVPRRGRSLGFFAKKSR